MSVTEALHVEQWGLIEYGTKERRARFGENELQSIRPRSAWRILVDQLSSFIETLAPFMLHFQTVGISLSSLQSRFRRSDLL
jgi:hypothetical protein